MRKLRKNDEVIVLAGRSKGTQGKVLQVLEKGKRLVVEGVNMIKKHVKANPQAGIEGGIIEKEAPIDISNVAIFNPITQKADRVGFKTVDGAKRRYFKSNDELIEDTQG